MFSGYIGRDFGQPVVIGGNGGLGGVASSRQDETPLIFPANTGFEWVGVDGATATIGTGYVVTYGRLVVLNEQDIQCTGSVNRPGIIFVEAKRMEEIYSYDLKCLSSDGFPGHTVDAWRIPLYAVYLDSNGNARKLHKLTSGLVMI